MVVFNSYVKLPEGKSFLRENGPSIDDMMIYDVFFPKFLGTNMLGTDMLATYEIGVHMLCHYVSKNWRPNRMIIPILISQRLLPKS